MVNFVGKKEFAATLGFNRGAMVRALARDNVVEVRHHPCVAYVVAFRPRFERFSSRYSAGDGDDDDDGDDNDDDHHHQIPSGRRHNSRQF